MDTRPTPKRVAGHQHVGVPESTRRCRRRYGPDPDGRIRFVPLRRPSRPWCRTSSTDAPCGGLAWYVVFRHSTVTSVDRYCRVNSCERMVAPAFPNGSFEPGMLGVPVGVEQRRDWQSAGELGHPRQERRRFRDSCPPLTSSALPGPSATTTLPPAPETTIKRWETGA